jgi:hypothetical protein
MLRFCCRRIVARRPIIRLTFHLIVCRVFFHVGEAVLLVQPAAAVDPFAAFRAEWKADAGRGRVELFFADRTAHKSYFGFF